MSKNRLGKHHISPSQKNPHEHQEKAQETPSTKIPAAIKTKSFLVDTFMVGMPVAYFVIYILMGGGKGFEEQKIAGWLLIFLLHAPVIITLLHLKSQTPGMKAYELKIITPNGSKPALLRLIIRYFATLISILSVVGIVAIKYRKDGLGLQDMLSGTRIVKA